MKKLVSLLLVMACTFSLAACGGSSEDTAKETVTAQVIEYDLTSEEYAFGVDKTQPELLEQVNTFVNKIG